MVKKNIVFLVAVMFFWVCLTTTASAYKDCSSACDLEQCCLDNHNEALASPPSLEQIYEFMETGEIPSCPVSCITGCMVVFVIETALCILGGGDPVACMALSELTYLGCTWLCYIICQASG